MNFNRLWPNTWNRHLYPVFLAFKPNYKFSSYPQNCFVWYTKWELYFLTGRTIQLFSTQEKHQSYCNSRQFTSKTMQTCVPLTPLILKSSKSWTVLARNTLLLSLSRTYNTDISIGALMVTIGSWNVIMTFDIYISPLQFSVIKVFKIFYTFKWTS